MQTAKTLIRQGGCPGWCESSLVAQFILLVLSYCGSCCNCLFPSCGSKVLLQKFVDVQNMWTASSEFGTYRLCEQRRFRQACASGQSRQNLRCSLIQAVSQEEPSDRKPDPWPLWMAGHAQLKYVMTECSKTQSRLTRLMYFSNLQFFWWHRQ